VHNHPQAIRPFNGQLIPDFIESSEADLRLTRRILEASKILEIQLVDHLIIGSPSGAQQPFYEATGYRQVNRRFVRQAANRPAENTVDYGLGMSAAHSRLKNCLGKMNGVHQIRDVMLRFSVRRLLDRIDDDIGSQVPPVIDCVVPERRSG
jgi:hypothetical protein